MVVKKRVPRDLVTMVMIEEIADEKKPAEPYYCQHNKEKKAKKTKTKAETFVTTMQDILDDATIIVDPFKAYLWDNLNNSNIVEQLQVVAESNALRAITPIVDGQNKIEAILDPRCQIVTMSKEVCNVLALLYNPTIRLHMVSANSGVDQSLRLARNIQWAQKLLQCLEILDWGGGGV